MNVLDDIVAGDVDELIFTYFVHDPFDDDEDEPEIDEPSEFHERVEAEEPSSSSESDSEDDHSLVDASQEKTKCDLQDAALEMNVYKLCM